MKKVFITTGTEHYLRQLMENYIGENVTLLQNFSQSLLYQESTGENLFQEGKEYRVLQSSGSLKGFGIVVFEYIQLRDEEIPIFLQMYQHASLHFSETPGLQSTKLTKAMNTNQFLIVSFWDSEVFFQEWKKTPLHKEITSIMKKNNTQVGFSHEDIYHYPEFSHDAK
ncbi:antibiotic biosynthesis monooxygenase family protein [Listeria sp. Marseille-Q6474]|uniref:antibiotic biosynthesis monooxygenase family protein n=1 Tax=Listeria sp. Marseille-Q6474 TaxID=2972774 RepID=UPI0021C83B6E|nr:antibiotic biosynthesis monooxygenase [Listeria sp. Marseille-Q6474]